jgi:sugar (pentulose or hexulose) kinase
MARAAMEGATFGLNYGLNRLRQLGLNPTEIRLTGGGANSAVWRQIMADIFQVEVVPVGGEGAAMGAALHALWAYKNSRRPNVTIESIVDDYIVLEEDNRARPNPQNAGIYAKMQSLFDALSKKTDDFKAHRAILNSL